MSLAQRSVHSASWATFTTIAALPINFIHSILLARWLPVEYFGIYAGVNSVILLSSTIFEFGFTNAFIHRSEETEDEDRAASTFFILRLIFEFFWAIILTVTGWFFFSDLRRYVLLVMVATQFLFRLSLTPKVLLIRRVMHRRMAVIDLSASFVSALVALSIAYFYHSIWALLISPIITMVFSIFGMYFWRPVWKPKLLWDRKTIRYFINFGSKNLVNNILETALENVDNLWTNIYLGDFMLGLYSRAYKFSIYPRMILASPITTVVFGTYAELKNDRKRLSKAFFQANAFLTRAGFFLAGWIAILAPYFIQLVIGERWMPMLSAFRLMLLFAMLDPIKGTISSALVAVGQPERISVVRVVQIVVLAAGLAILGPLYQIAGVALAMDLMVFIGTVLSIWYVRPLIDISWLKLFSAPLAALAVAMGTTYLVANQFSADLSYWAGGILKLLLFPLLYFGVLIILEGRRILRSSLEILSLFSLQEWLGTTWRAVRTKD